MSLIDRTGRTAVTLYPEVLTQDKDGNPHRIPSTTGIETYATVHPMGFSGTAARRAEMDREGHLSEAICSVYFDRDDPLVSHPIGAQSTLVVNGKTWQFFGDGKLFNGSPRTWRYTYQIKRS